MKYRKKPVVVDAIQWNGSNIKELEAFVTRGLSICHAIGVDVANGVKYYVSIQTLEGEHLVREGDYIIKGVKGEFYPCKPDIFEQTYEKVGDNE